MIAEWIMDLWTLETEKIENRVGRYETKARLKKIFHPKDDSNRSSMDQETESLHPEPSLGTSSTSIDVNIKPAKPKMASASLPSGFVHIQPPRRTSFVKNRQVSQPSRIFSYNNRVSFFDSSPSFKRLASTEDGMETGPPDEDLSP
jgi:hypothetical protein